MDLWFNDPVLPGKTVTHHERGNNKLSTFQTPFAFEDLTGHKIPSLLDLVVSGKLDLYLNIFYDHTNMETHGNNNS